MHFIEMSIIYLDKYQMNQIVCIKIVIWLLLGESLNADQWNQRLGARCKWWKFAEFDEL